jgi:hypothetical protein
VEHASFDRAHLCSVVRLSLQKSFLAINRLQFIGADLSLSEPGTVGVEEFPRQFVLSYTHEACAVQEIARRQAPRSRRGRACAGGVTNLGWR